MDWTSNVKLLKSNDDAWSMSVESLTPNSDNLTMYGHWGVIPSTMLLGVSLCQGYFYFSQYDDRLAVKVLVAFLLILEISATSLLSSSLHTLLIGNLGKQNPSNGENPFLASQIITIVITLLTQIFFAHQVYRLYSKKPAIPLIIVVFASLSTCAGITRITFAMTPPYHEVLKPVFKIMATCEGGFAAMTDIGATTAMCFKFVESAMYTRRLSTVVRLLLIYTVNRGVLVTAVQTFIVALLWYGPDKFYWAPIYMCVGKLYVNTLLGMLNSRQRLRSKSVLMRSEITITQINSNVMFKQAPLQPKCSVDLHQPLSSP